MRRFSILYEAVVITGGQKTIEHFDLNVEIGKDLEKHLVDYLAENQPAVTLVKMLSVMLDHKCVACRFDEPGQSPHMEAGGCLEYVKIARAESDW
jgi:hypothetical protein